MNVLCDDNRFELIEKYKKELIDATNIETAPDEMAVLDDILFRFWQMGWLDSVDRMPLVKESARTLMHSAGNSISAKAFRNAGRFIQNAIDGEPPEFEKLLSAQPTPHWIPCSERLPECEQEVLICTKKKVVGKNAYIDSIITPALYEDGTMLEIDSKWRWEDIDYDKWDEENDCGIIPEGWWENRHFNPDDVYNNVVDREVVAWMQMPEPYRGDDHAD